MGRFPFAHTFSIVARDPASGQLGVAVQSHWFSVGSVVTWAEAGVGAIATQAMADITYGPLGLDLLRAGKPAPAALAALLTSDPQANRRQVAMIDARGEVGVHTGSGCMQGAGHENGEGFCVQANMMLNNAVWPAMAAAYRSAAGSAAAQPGGSDLAERMLLALEAGQAAGGDVRGQQSAAILIVSGTSTGRPWADRVMELRVEDHPQPIAELRRLVRIQRAYDFMNKGDEFLAKEQVEDALQAYRAAAALAPEIDELPFWHAVTLADLGRLEEALPIFAGVFRSSPNWAELLKRLPPVGLLRDDPEMLRIILAAAAEK
jgi:uncharacterized Ntn-hydrolase superfamily protein